MQREERRAGPSNRARKLGRAADPRPLRPVDVEEIRLRRAELTRGVPVPEPPFWGARDDRRACRCKALLPYLNERMLYQFQWGYRKDGRSLDEYKEWARGELRPILDAHPRHRDPRGHPACRRRPTAIGAAPREGNDVILFDEDGRREVARFAFPRQNKEGGLCIADFFRDVERPASAT